MDSQNADSVRHRLTELRSKLLALHKLLLEDERGHYVRAHGQVTSGEMLRLVLDNGQFAWLRFISGLVVRIDELLEEDDPLPVDEVNSALGEASKLLTPAEISTSFEEKYQAALQSNPSAVMAHRDIRELLSRGT